MTKAAVLFKKITALGLPLLMVVGFMGIAHALPEGWQLQAPNSTTHKTPVSALSVTHTAPQSHHRLQAITPSTPENNPSFYARVPLPFGQPLWVQDLPRTLTFAQQHEAQIWHLTTSEEARYVALMQSTAGVDYAGKHLSPVTILGFNAPTDKARHHFALLAAKHTAVKIAKELAFSAAYQRAYAEIIPANFPALLGEPTQHRHPLPPVSDVTIPPLQKGDSLWLFLRMNALQKPVPHWLSAAVAKVLATQGVTLHLRGVGEAGTPTHLQALAKKLHLPRAAMSQGVIFMKPAGSAWASLNARYQTPALFLARGGNSVALTGRTHTRSMG